MQPARSVVEGLGGSSYECHMRTASTEAVYHMRAEPTMLAHAVVENKMT